MAFLKSAGAVPCVIAMVAFAGARPAFAAPGDTAAVTSDHPGAPALERARAALAAGRKGGNAAFAEARQSAADELKEAVRLEPKLLPAYWELVLLAERTPAGREKRLRGHLESLRDRDADGWFGAVATARLRLLERDQRGALDLLAKAVERGADEPLPYVERARLQLLFGNPAEALKDSDQSLTKSAARPKSAPESVEALVLHAEIRRALHDTKGALADLEQASKSDPSWAPAHGLRALLECETVAPGWEADADKALALDDHEVFALFTKAIALGLDKPSFAGRAVKDAAARGQARELLEKCRARDDTFVPALQVAATLAIRDAAFDEALRLCDRVLEIDAANARAIATRGVIFMRQGETERARIQLDKALEYDPELQAALIARGELEIKSKPATPDEAIRDLDRAIRIDNDCPEAYFLRGHAKYSSRTRRNRFPEAISDLTTAVDTADKDALWLPTAYLLRGLAYQVLKKYREAIDDFDEAEKLAGPRPAGNNDLQTLQKQRAKAREDLEKAEKAAAEPPKPPIEPAKPQPEAPKADAPKPD